MTTDILHLNNNKNSINNICLPKIVSSSETETKMIKNNNSISHSIMLKYEMENTINTIKEENNSIVDQLLPSKSTTSSIVESTSQSPSQTSLIVNGGSKSILDSSKINKKILNNNLNTIARKRWKILAKAIKKVDHINNEFESNEETINVTTNVKQNFIVNNNHNNIDDNNIVVDDNDDYGNDNSINIKLNIDDTTTNDEDSFLASVRRFSSFNLVNKNLLTSVEKNQLLGVQSDNWFSYKMNLSNIQYNINVHHVNRSLNAIDLMGFNNTGNICVWPSEEALAYYALNNLKLFQNKMILELGGGMTCLAGLLIAKYGNPYCVHLTDGNRISIENVKRTLHLNDDINCYVKCSQLKWENQSNSILYDEYERFQYIICADCLFFDDVRMALVDTIWYFLSKTGKALIMAPKRGKTLDEFLRIANAKGFHYEIKYKYNDIIWERHIKFKNNSKSVYDENLHYPILIILTKKKKQIIIK